MSDRACYNCGNGTFIIVNDDKTNDNVLCSKCGVKAGAVKIYFWH